MISVSCCGSIGCLKSLAVDEVSGIAYFGDGYGAIRQMTLDDSNVKTILNTSKLNLITYITVHELLCGPI